MDDRELQRVTASREDDAARRYASEHLLAPLVADAVRRADAMSRLDARLRLPETGAAA